MIGRELASRIERLIGSPVESYTPVAGGYTPAVRLRCRTPAARIESVPVLVLEDLSAAQWPPPWDARRLLRLHI
jgi:hypothetical protein